VEACRVVKLKMERTTVLTDREFLELLKKHRGWLEDDSLRFPTVENKRQFMDAVERIEVVEGH
jgi:hypothetical protein